MKGRLNVHISRRHEFAGAQKRRCRGRHGVEGGILGRFFGVWDGILPGPDPPRHRRTRGARPGLAAGMSPKHSRARLFCRSTGEGGPPRFQFLWPLPPAIGCCSGHNSTNSRRSNAPICLQCSHMLRPPLFLLRLLCSRGAESASRQLLRAYLSMLHGGIALPKCPNEKFDWSSDSVPSSLGKWRCQCRVPIIGISLQRNTAAKDSRLDASSIFSPGELPASPKKKETKYGIHPAIVGRVHSMSELVGVKRAEICKKKACFCGGRFIPSSICASGLTLDSRPWRFPLVVVIKRRDDKTRNPGRLPSSPRRRQCRPARPKRREAERRCAAEEC